MKNIAAALAIVVIAAAALPALAVEPVPRAQYLAYARAAADQTWDGREELLARWKKTFDPLYVFGYNAPGGLLETACIYSYLYEKESKAVYADRVREILLTYGDYRTAYPESSIKMRPDYADGVPALPNFFTTMRYIQAYDRLNRLKKFSADERTKIEALIADSIRYLLRTQEWGAMNRAALRAETLAWAVRALPNHPDRPKWEMQRDALAVDNWGTWQIEDAQLYNGVWLYALLGYSDALGRQADLFATPEWRYYSEYYLHLMSPGSVVPDFGDAHWQSNWYYFLAYFETAAARYKDARLKWAASTIARKFLDFKAKPSIGLALFLLDAGRWGADGIPAREPAELSGEVMEDVVGKKIVFRSGWQPDSTYLLLNYRDEGDGGLQARDYLRDSIPVEEEKMTHGHADENSIPLLMSGGAILLRDGGYRDFMPSGPYGAFRQDYFHNRLCVRPEKIFMGQKEGEFRYANERQALPGQTVLEFIQNAGSYRRTRTQKIDFLTFADFDYSRTRVIDDGWGWQGDRIVVYVKDPEMFVVFDVLKALKEEYFTMANFWHTRKILARGEHWYDTVYDRIQTTELPQPKSLLVAFPLTARRFESVEPIKRHFQDETAIIQTAFQHFELGETLGLVTVLIPHAPGEKPEDLLKRIRPLTVDPERGVLGVLLQAGGRDIVIGVKNDLRRDMMRDWRRPRYDYSAGRIRVGDFETDGDFLFATRAGSSLSYTIVNLTKAFHAGRALVEAKEANFGLAYDASPDQGGLGKIRYWRDTVEVK